MRITNGAGCHGRPVVSNWCFARFRKGTLANGANPNIGIVYERSGINLATFARPGRLARVSIDLHSLRSNVAPATSERRQVALSRTLGLSDPI